jgi:Rad3-related DNA helicase
MNQLSQKLVTENTIFVQADKGKTIVIIKSDAYSNKVHAFLAAKKITLLPKDLTGKYKKLIQKTLQQCNLIMTKT